MIDNIHDNILNAKDYIEKAEVVLKDEKKEHKKSRKKLCCIILIGVVILAIIIVPIILTIVNNNKNKTPKTTSWFFTAFLIWLKRVLESIDKAESYLNSPLKIGGAGGAILVQGLSLYHFIVQVKRTCVVLRVGIKYFRLIEFR